MYCFTIVILHVLIDKNSFLTVFKRQADGLVTANFELVVTNLCLFFENRIDKTTPACYNRRIEGVDGAEMRGKSTD